MPQGLSLHIGLNRIGPSHYIDWPSQGRLHGCHNDAQAMYALAHAEGFEGREPLLDADATTEAIQAEVMSAASELNPGDHYLVTFSGHGAWVPDTNSEELDMRDETWCVWDRQIVDDEIYFWLSHFREGVRILIVSDSCRSGSVIEAIDFGEEPRFRGMPEFARRATLTANEELYEGIQNDHPDGDTLVISASAILLSACLDNELARDGDDHGLFTAALLEHWEDGGFQGSHVEFHQSIKASLLGTGQTPNYLARGAEDPAFAGKRPFTL